LCCLFSRKNGRGKKHFKLKLIVSSKIVILV
jgi:hypothetical protein